MLPKLDILDTEIDARNALATNYSSCLSSDDRLTCPVLISGNHSAWAQYTLKVSDRDGFIQKLNNANVPAAIHYPMPLNKQPAVRDSSSILQFGDKISKEVVSLPMHAYMTEEVFNKIVQSCIL